MLKHVKQAILLPALLSILVNAASQAVDEEENVIVWVPERPPSIQLEDLSAQESRYKVVAKPVPYKPPQPAPPIDDWEINISSTTENSAPKFKSFKPVKKQYENANVIYPTTTYRPQQFQLSDLLQNDSSEAETTEKTTTTTRASRRSKKSDQIINEIPFGVKSQRKPKNKGRKVVKRVKKTNSLRWRQNHPQTTKKPATTTTTTAATTTRTTTEKTTTKRPFPSFRRDKSRETVEFEESEEEENSFHPFTPLPPLKPRPNLFKHNGDDDVRSPKNIRKAQFSRNRFASFSTPAPDLPPVPTFSPAPEPDFGFRAPAVPNVGFGFRSPSTPAPEPLIVSTPAHIEALRHSPPETFIHSTPAPFIHSTPAPSIHSTPVPHRHSTPEHAFLRHSTPAPKPLRHSTPKPLSHSTPAPEHIHSTFGPVHHGHSTPAPVHHRHSTPAPLHHGHSAPAPIIHGHSTPHPPVRHSPPAPAPIQPAYGAPDLPENEIEYFEEAKPYSFTYGVKDEYSGTDFSRAEESYGEVTRGSYKVALPDGRTQIVSYVADDDGYKASVTYEGSPVYPAPDQYKATGPAHSDVFHVLPPVLHDKNHASYDVGPAAPAPPAPEYDEYEYYDDTAPAHEIKSLSPAYASPAYGSPTPSPAYGSPSPSPAYGSPSPSPAYGSPSPSPAYGSPSPSPAYGSPTPSPAYGAPSPSPAYGSPSPSPAYGSPSPAYEEPAPGYGSPTPSPAYGAPSPSPAYDEPSPAYGPPSPSYGAPTPSPSYGAPTPSPSYGAPSPSPGYGAPTPSPSYGAPTPSPSYGAPSPSPSYGAPTPSPGYGAPEPIYGSPTYGSPEPEHYHGYSPTTPAYIPTTPVPKEAYYTTPAPLYDTYVTASRSLPKKFGLKKPGYRATPSPYLFTPSHAPQQDYKQVFKRNNDKPKTKYSDDYDYEYYEDDSSSSNRRSDQVQLVIAEHLSDK